VRAPMPPIAARALSGDLDAIVAKALRKTAADRYRSVTDLETDIARHLRNEPVSARAGARLYVFGRLLRRYRWAATATAVLVLALSAGLAGTLWQAHRAEQQARLAAASRDFMMGLFAAQDPQQSGDRPRQDLTVHQLLDAGVARIERDFADEPEVQIELLGTASRIYNSLGDDKQLARVQARRSALARAHFGPTHPIVIEQLINDANTACTQADFAKADRLLAESDRLLTVSRADRSVLRATWWQIKARVLGKADGGAPARAQALAKALALYEQVAPRTDGHATVLSMMAIDRANASDPAGAKRLLDETVAIAQAATDRHDGHIAEYLFNLARTDEDVGDFKGALVAYSKGEKIALATYGPQHSTYFLSRIFHARLLHMRGDAKTAAPIFAEAISRIPDGGGKASYASWARETYAARLAAEGRANEALPLLEASYRNSLAQPRHDFDARESARLLGDANDRLGHLETARALLKSSRDDYIAKEGADSEYGFASRERWARFELDHSAPGDADFAAAQTEFRAIVRDIGKRPLPERALALSGLARIALAHGEAKPARALSEQALASLAAVPKLHDVRIEPALWLVHSATLLANGDPPGALAMAQRAEAASRRYDMPGARSVVQAQAAVRQASHAMAGR
jgi:eukaryotic-like serine/threonine-protein kinase